MARHRFFILELLNGCLFFQKLRKQQVAILCPESRVNSKHWHEEKYLDQTRRSELLMGQTAT